MSVKIAIDVGGTFTDVAASMDADTVLVHKELNVRDEPLEAVRRGIETVLDQLGCSWADVDVIVHGTTIATNAILTRTGARVALLTTKGFRDTLSLRRGRRNDIYNSRRKPPAPLVPRHLRYEVDERTRPDGSVSTVPDRESVEDLLGDLARHEVESVAVCLLHSYTNPENEEKLAETISRFAQERGLHWHIAISSRLTREIGFYERTSTVVLDSFVAPRVVAYLDELESALGSQGFEGPCIIMQSNSGAAMLRHARRQPIRTLNSGPTGAVNAGKRLLETMGSRDCVTFDMGGTSCDVCLLVDGQPLERQQSEIGEQALHLPVTDIVTIGAGGGSICRVNDIGLLRVGPESAAAYPGPACYGLGGTLATVTDADLVLGLIDPSAFLAAGALDRPAAFAAVQGLAKGLGIQPMAAARAVYQLVNRMMADAIREVTARKGYDPRLAPLVVGGGAGPLHACEVAKLLDMRLVVIPSTAAVLSAAGLLEADLKYDRVATVGPYDLDDCPWGECLQLLETLETANRSDLGESRVTEHTRTERRVDVRYRGQFNTLSVELPPEAADGFAEEIRERFVDAHRRRYLHGVYEDPLEVCAVRSVGLGLRAEPTRANAGAAMGTTRGPVWKPSTSTATAEVGVADDLAPVPVLPAEAVTQQEGPLLARTAYWSAWIPADYTCRQDSSGNLLLYPTEDDSLAALVA